MEVPRPGPNHDPLGPVEPAVLLGVVRSALALRRLALTSGLPLLEVSQKVYTDSGNEREVVDVTLDQGRRLEFSTGSFMQVDFLFDTMIRDLDTFEALLASDMSVYGEGGETVGGKLSADPREVIAQVRADPKLLPMQHARQNCVIYTSQNPNHVEELEKQMVGAHYYQYEPRGHLFSILNEHGRMRNFQLAQWDAIVRHRRKAYGALLS